VLLLPPARVNRLASTLMALLNFVRASTQILLPHKQIYFANSETQISENATAECFRIEITKILQDDNEITKINMYVYIFNFKHRKYVYWNIQEPTESLIRMLQSWNFCRKFCRMSQNATLECFSIEVTSECT